MKFRIIEEAWGINRKTGERKVRRTAERIFTPEAGQIIEFPLGRRKKCETAISPQYDSSVYYIIYLKAGPL